MSRESTLVLDVGSLQTNIGLAGDNAPLYSIPTLISSTGKIGHEIISNKKTIYPIKKNLIHDKESFSKFLKKTSELDYSDAKLPYSYLFSNYYYRPPRMNELLVNICFEELNAVSMFCVTSSLLALYTAGISTGIVVSLDDQSSTVSCISDGLISPEASKKYDLNCEHLTKFAMQTYGLDRESYDNGAYCDKMQYSELRNSTLNYDSKNEANDEFTLPDNKKIKLVNKSEAILDEIFSPFNTLLDSVTERHGLQYFIYETSNAYKTQEKNLLFQNLILTGPLEQSDVFLYRLKNELNTVLPSTTNLKIKNNTAFNNTTWRGGSIFCSLSNAYNMFITEQDYFEVGPTIIHRKLI